jgi:hypothetical protein
MSIVVSDRGGNPRRTHKEALERCAYDNLPPLKPRTQERYRTSFRQLNAVFGNLYLDEIIRGRLTKLTNPPDAVCIKSSTEAADHPDRVGPAEHRDRSGWSVWPHPSDPWKSLSLTVAENWLFTVVSTVMLAVSQTHPGEPRGAAARSADQDERWVTGAVCHT